MKLLMYLFGSNKMERFLSDNIDDPRVVADNAAYKLLEHFAEVAPYSSYNIAALYNLEARQKSILERETEEKISLIAKNPEPVQAKILSESKRYKAWYAMTSSVSFQEHHKKITAEQEATKKDLKEYGNEVLALFSNSKTKGEILKIVYHAYRLEEAAIAYKIVTASKTGACGVISNAGLFYLANDLKYSYPIKLFSGKADEGFTHTFMVLNCAQEILEYTPIDQLPKEAVIVDLWLRCKYTPANARTIWENHGVKSYRESSLLCRQFSSFDPAIAQIYVEEKVKDKKKFGSK